jgi:hypothetical protein
MASAARSRQLSQRAPQERTHAMVVGVGLYALRYMSAPANAAYPLVEVRSRSQGNDITLIAAPGGYSDRLVEPGDCIIVRAEQSGSLELTVSTDSPRASLDAEFRLERLTPPPQAARKAGPSASVAPVAQAGAISVMAHVSRRGDVVASPGEWICGPDMPLPIEGLQIDWPNKPAGVELTYVVTAGRSAQKRKLSGRSGSFAGTRGKSMPLVAIEMSLAGPNAAGYELEVEALFLGAAIAAQSGQSLSLTGPSAREPLVGLRFNVSQKRAAPLERSGTPKTLPGKAPRQVRVYRPAVVAGRSLSPMKTSNSNH